MGTNFVVFSTPRSGSTLLIKTLDKHPAILAAGELFFLKGKIFHNEERYPFLRIPFFPAKLNYLVNYPLISLKLKGFLNRFYSKHAEAVKAKGFKLMLFQTYYTPGVLDYLRDNNVKVIVLIRKNVLRNAISDLKARDTKVYHESESNEKAFQKIKIDLNQLEKKMVQIKKFDEELMKKTENMTRKILYYEDFENWEESVSAVLQFLEVEALPLVPASKKLNPDNLKEMIDNYDELKEWLHIKGFETYLTDSRELEKI